MLTAGSSVGAPDRSATESPPTPDRRSTLLFWVVVAVASLPVVVTAASVIGHEWHPASDVAIEVLRINEVGGSNTPVTGAHSRYGWDHPGPLLFWWLAPFSSLFGTIGVLVGVAVLNAVAIVGALLIARRRGGLALTALVALVLIALCRETDLLVDPWNPWVAVLPFFTYLLLVWSLADRDFGVLPWLVGVGTFAIQAHVGYAPLVLGAGVVSALVAWRWPPASARGHDGVRRHALVALAVGGLLWLPPVAEQLLGDGGNLGEIVRYFRDPAEAQLGVRAAWGIMGTELGVPGAWLAGGELGPFGVRTSSVIPALVLLVVTAGLGILAVRRGNQSGGRLALLVVVVSGLGVIATSRITGIVGDYLVRWWWAIAAAVWLSFLWSISCSLPARARHGLFVLSVVACALLSAVTAWRAVPAGVPNPDESVAIGQLGRDVIDDLDPDGAYLVDWTDGRDWGAVGTGLFLHLDEHGISVAVPARHEAAIREHRTARADEVDGVIMVVDSDAGQEARPPGAEVIAQFDPLTARERSRAGWLEEEIRKHVASPDQFMAEQLDSAIGRDVLESDGAPRWAIDELAKLRAQGPAYTVSLQP